MSHKKILEDAAKRLETTGWHQGSNGDDSGPNCAAGAIYHVVPATNEVYRVRLTDILTTLVERHLKLKHDTTRGFALTVWNDTIGRTRDQVIEALRGTAAGLPEEQ